MDFKNCDGVTTVCYGKVQEWKSRSEAKNHFLDAMFNSDGSERERYSTIFLKIVLGYSYCTDDIDD